MPAVSSAAGLLTLLEDDNDELKQYALVNLDKVVHDYWFQISGSIAAVEALSEDDEFADRELASLIASKVFYHLGELESALAYALGAGTHFKVNEQSEYVQTLVARCLDQYFSLRVKQVEGKEDVSIDPRLVTVVESMIDRCCEAGYYEQAVGVAMEGRRLDKLEEIISRSSNMVTTLSYALGVCQKLVTNRDFRQQVLRLLIRLYEASPAPNWVEICQCLMFLDDAPEVAKILEKLINGSEDNVLLAYQVAFDLVENEMQSFLQQVQDSLPKPSTPAEATAAVDGAAPAAAGAGEPGGAAAMDTDAAPPPAAEANGGPPAAEAAAGEEVPEALRQPLTKLRDILSGKTPIGLSLEFLYHNNHADLQILKQVKGAVDARVSVCHSATVLANALMHAGTSIDTFLRENLEWLSRATNWAKFSATAGLGVIHRGQLQQGRALMAPYLPRDGPSGSQYSEGGALYALGLITANHGHDIREFLLTSLRNASGGAGGSKPIIQHGACLGLGLAALGTNDEEIIEDMKNVLFTDDAVAGEAAGIGMGLICCGTGSEKALEMLAYAHDTAHEKIIRGLALGLAIISYGREEAADALVDQMSSDQDPILRYGAMYVLGLAYRATGNNAAVQRLLHFAVSDVSDDVRRAAVLCLGFVLMNVPEQCPKIVSLLAESFNPHVRYGAAMAVGLACAGSGAKEAVSLLEGMMTDNTDFVRQGVCMALAMVLMQQPHAKVEPFRKKLAKIVADKHEEVMARMGAIVATGILDAGGRNVTIGLRSRSGYPRRTSVVGLAVFTAHWYWYPLSYFLSLAFQPTAIIGLDKSLKAPKVPLVCNAKPSLFAYPPPVTAEASKEVAKVEKAVLSTTAKAKERQKKKDVEKAEKEKAEGAAAATKAAEGATDMETDEKKGEASTASGSGAAAADAPAKKEEEPSSFTMEAPCRVVPSQVPFVSFLPDSRWVPVKQGAAPVGFLVLKDTQPGEPVEYASSTLAGGSAAAAAGQQQQAAPGAAAPVGGAAQQEQEPPPPEPFEFEEN